MTPFCSLTTGKFCPTTGTPCFQRLACLKGQDLSVILSGRAAGPIIWLSVNKHQVRSDVEIAATLPVARQCMVVKLLCQRLVVRKSLNCGNEIFGNAASM